LEEFCLNVFLEFKSPLNSGVDETKTQINIPGFQAGPSGAAATAVKVSLPRQIEQEILAEGREWTRRRLQQRLQQLADKQGEISPLKPKKDKALPEAPSSTFERFGTY
jgi:hypothetical protein